jgi:putative transposase
MDSVQDTFFVVCDGLKGLPEVVSNVWPQAIVQTCIIHYADLRIMPMRSWDSLRDSGFVPARSA